MRIAIPVSEGQLAQHFGHCEMFALLDVDPDQVAWLITGWAFAGDVSHLMGFKKFLAPNVGEHWLDVIFSSFAAEPAPPAA